MLVAVLGPPRAAPAATIAGPARVIDGDTIVVAGTRVRLFGIDAPELRQRCRRWYWRSYRCGRDAAVVLARLTRGRTVECQPRGHDKHRRMVATCATDMGDLGAEMVRRGWALDFARYSAGRYRPEQAAARAARLGLWAGRFKSPEQWRRERRR